MKIFNSFNIIITAILIVAYVVMSVLLCYKFPQYNHISLYFIPFIVAAMTGITHHFLIKFAAKKTLATLSI